MLRIVYLLMVLALSLVACNGYASAQSSELRYQLGRRLTRFEKRWETAEPAARARSTPKMMAAVNSFFSLQIDAAIMLLDEAWLAVEEDSVINTPQAVSDAGWFVNVRPLLLDSDAHALSLALSHCPPGSKFPLFSKTCDLSIAIVDARRNVIVERRWNSVTELDTWDWELDSLPPGDYQVTARLHRGESETDVIANRFSVISNMEMRLELVRSQSQGRRSTAIDTKSLSLQSMAKMIAGARDGRMTESDLPYDALLSDLELLAEEKGTVRELVASRPERSLWLQLGNGKNKQHVRLQTANNANGAPLVVAYHGAGGSENMFFESYGAGRLVDLCRQKGWSIVAPRQPLMGMGMDLDAMLDELRTHLDFDPERVFLIGHSMGAAQAISQISKYPTRVRAVAAIGGGGSPIKSAELNRIPFIVAAGEKDFGLRQAKSLSTTLQAFGAKVDFLEVKDVEHMVIVQATLNEVMTFFEKHQ